MLAFIFISCLFFLGYAGLLNGWYSAALLLGVSRALFGIHTMHMVSVAGRTGVCSLHSPAVCCGQNVWEIVPAIAHFRHRTYGPLVSSRAADLPLRRLPQAVGVEVAGLGLL